MGLLDEQQAPDPLDVTEATLATIGLTRILDGDMPLVGVMLQRHILAMPRRISSACDDLVNDRLPRALKMPRPFGYDEMLETFTQPIPEQAIEKILSKFPPNVSEQAMTFVQFLARTYKHVADMLPVQQYETLLGKETIEPTGDKLWMFWNRYWVINDPMTALTLAQSGALLPEQVAALQEFYPSLYEHMKTGILTALAKRRLHDSSFLNLVPRAQRGVQTFLQQRVVDFQSNLHKVQPDKLKQTMAQGSPSKALETPGQKAANIT